MQTIRDLFSTRRPIDRQIEKVIDYYADDEDRLAAEIEEYEATDNVEACFRKFLDVYQAGIQGGHVTEIGIWVAGFYGSGKSSFTKYLGFALDQDRIVHGQPFLERLADRIRSTDIKEQLRTVARRIPTAVVLLDLGAEQLVESSTVPVSTVLYWKVLQMAGYSKEKKLAQLELTLTKRNLYDDFKVTYEQTYGQPWEEIHNDPLLGVSRASKLLPAFMPQDFSREDSFSRLRFEMADDVRDLARQLIQVVRETTGRENILFLIDEAGQYVAPRGELILNLDGLARNLKELGQGKVWIVATGQQTLAEIVERAAHNSPELNKLRDRFPIAIELDARDIREITYRRLLTKQPEADSKLHMLFQQSGPALITHTRLHGAALYNDDPMADDFVRYYPFLPQHFEVLIELIRVLARSTGGIGLRSVIRVIQDVLVDTSRILRADEQKLADKTIGTLACVDDFFKTLRADIRRLLPHVVDSVDQVERLYHDRPMHLRVAMAVAALQPLGENFPRSAENLAALLYPTMGHPSILDEVHQALADLVEDKPIGLIEDPQSGGYLFLSSSVAPLQRKRGDYVPTGGEVAGERNRILRGLLEPQPMAKLENVRTVQAEVRMGKTLLIGAQEEMKFQLEMVSGENWDSRRTGLLTETTQQAEYHNVIVWLFKRDDVADDILPEIVKSERITREIDERTADKDVAQFLRAERSLAERNRERVEARLRDALLGGTFIFRGRPTPVLQIGETLEASAREILGQAAREVFHQYHLVKIRPGTDLAARFLEVERLDRMPSDRDPLRLVVHQGSSPRIDLNNPALAETLRAFRDKVDESGGGRLTGKTVQDFFAAAPYGWSNDAVRYLFAALLVAGEIELHTGGEILKTAGPAAIEAFKNTLAFNKVGLGLRDSRVSLEVLDRAARRLQSLFGEDVLPLEDHISRAARKHLPNVLETIGALPARLRLLGLPGEERANNLLAQLTELLRGDASDAPSRLGVKDSSIPDDIEWGRATTRALSDGGEHDIRQANALLSGLAELDSFFPGQRDRLVTESEWETIQAILKTEHFYEQLPDLRGIIRRVRQRVREAYAKLWETYRANLEEAQDVLEAHPDWLYLSPEDQADLAGQLVMTLPQTPAEQTPMGDYKTLLVRTRGLPGFLEELKEEVVRRKLPLDLPPPEEEQIEQAAAERLEQKEAELVQARKLEYLGIMASAMAHGLNQPIGIIRAVSSTSLSDFVDGLLTLEEVPPRFEKIKQQTDRLAHIIDNMRAFARGDSRQRDQVDLGQVMAQMCDMFLEQFKNRHIELDCSLEGNEGPLLVWANPVQLQEVLINLITNARDAVEGQAEAWVRLNCWRAEDGQCVLAVEDNGPGLSAEVRRQLFVPFVTTKPSEQGTGLGLFTSRRMIEDLGGNLRYEDRSGSGACFVVELPPMPEA